MGTVIELEITAEEYQFLLKKIGEFRKEKEREKVIKKNEHCISSAMAACVGDLGIEKMLDIVSSLVNEWNNLGVL